MERSHGPLPPPAACPRRSSCTTTASSGASAAASPSRSPSSCSSHSSRSAARVRVRSRGTGRWYRKDSGCGFATIKKLFRFYFLLSFILLQGLEVCRFVPVVRSSRPSDDRGPVGGTEGTAGVEFAALKHICDLLVLSFIPHCVSV